MPNLIIGLRDKYTNRSSVLIPYGNGRFFTIIGQWQWGEKIGNKWIGGAFYASPEIGLTVDEIERLYRALSSRFK